MARKEPSDRGDAVKIRDLDEEIIAVSYSSDSDLAFDGVIGCIERILVGSQFQQLQGDFLEKYYLEFDESDENKLSYTAMFNEYVDLLEKHLEQQLMERIPDFNMKTFTELLMQRKDEVQDDVFETLMTFTDFLTFKEMFLDYKAEKEGRGLDLSLAFVVTPVSAAPSRCSP
ncbi:ADP-ribosylation factor-like protein 2-binding protein [Oryzias melastigma]|uniref:ADP-ribosylation factor-like protein 2-binding protein n=1 Tax=Oryzias melastigma TaxID=30732 RepID=A0A3B3CKJ6_ORYME|nr:ADP-ribosylation factor-like protein 2-binding protein [Oryzias melastigma]